MGKNKWMHLVKKMDHACLAY